MKKLTPLSLLWISFTSMVGSGWLFGSLYSAHYAGPAAVIAWPLAAFLLLFVALAYAEVATLFPEPNILCRLPLYTHGRLTSVILTGLAWISLATIPVIETQGLIQYASNYLPHLVVKHGVSFTITPIGYMMALIVLMSFVVLNYFGIQFFSYINSLFTIWKLIIPTLTVIMLFSLHYQPANFTQAGGFMPYGLHGVMEAISTGGVLFSLLGFRQVVVMMNDVENPQKYVPIILITSLILTGVLYSVLQWVFIGSMRAEDLANGWRHLSFKGDAGPFAALAAAGGMIWLSLLLYVDAIISPYSTGLVYSTTAARLLTGMEEIGTCSSVLCLENKYQVPWVSLLANFLLASLMFFLLHDWQAMASFLVAVLMISYSIGPISLMCFRKQYPQRVRPFRLPFGEVIAFIGFYVCTAGVYWAGLVSVVKVTIITLICLIIYFLDRFKQNRNEVLNIKNASWLIVYLISLCVFSYLGNYGGQHVIPAYWDLLYLLVLSLGVFMMAIANRILIPNNESF